MRTINLFVLLAFLTGCGGSNDHPTAATAATTPTEDQNDPYAEGLFINCGNTTRDALNQCLTEHKSVGAKLLRNLNNWETNGFKFWVPIMIDTQHFHATYQLSESETACIKATFCKKIKFDNPDGE